jgi:hypothetical protein
VLLLPAIRDPQRPGGAIDVAAALIADLAGEQSLERHRRSKSPVVGVPRQHRGALAPGEEIGEQEVDRVVRGIGARFGAQAFERVAIPVEARIERVGDERWGAARNGAVMDEGLAQPGA